MPELPEVETTINGLKSIIGNSINNIKINTPKLRFLIPKSIINIKSNTKIKDIRRRGKFIIIFLSCGYSIVIHLGMSGRLRLFKRQNYIKKKHDHFILKTNKEHLLIFNDARRFGFIDYDFTKKIYSRRYIKSLGKEALDRTLTGQYLILKISKKMVPIKQILLDQKIIAGIGNIYASEILFESRISPLELGKNMNLIQCNSLVTSVKKILRKSIKFGGSTLKDYVSSDGTLGNFQNNFKVYNKKNYMIKGKKIIKIIQYGRSTYYCPELQILNKNK